MQNLEEAGESEIPEESRKRHTGLLCGAVWREATSKYSVGLGNDESFGEGSSIIIFFLCHNRVVYTYLEPHGIAIYLF